MPTKKKPTLKDTGERMIPEFHEGNFMFGEHMVRYESAVEFVKGKTVLDIACGSGYGTKILSSSAKKVYGVDIDEESVKYAKKNYFTNNTEFMVGSATNIPLNDQSVDRVVSFETIEHIEDYKKFMLEIKRVLKTEGSAIISTPNDLEFSESNHFHIHEFKYKEFAELLHEHFKSVDFYFQGAWVCNGIFKDSDLNSKWSNNIKVLNLSPKEVDKAIYFFAVVSDAKIEHKIDPIVGISDHWSQRAIEDENTKSAIHNRNMDALLTIEKQRVSLLEEQKKQLTIELQAIKSTAYWKLRSRVSRLARHLRFEKK